MAEIDWDSLPDAPSATRPDVDWDALPDAPAPTMGAARAATLGVAQGGTMGFADEIGGALGSLFVPESSVKLGPAAMPSASDSEEEFQAKANLIEGMANAPTSYELVRDNMRQETKEAKEQHRAAYMAGEIGGGIAGSIAGNILVPGGGMIGRAAMEGAAAGLGSSEADLLKGEVAGAVADTAFGGAVGGLAGMAGGAITSRLPGAARATQDGLESAAQGRAVKAATGQNRKAINKMVEAGELDLDTGTIERVGSDLLNEGVVSAGASTREIMERAAAQKEAWGKTIGETLDHLDSLGASINVPSLADDMERSLVHPLRGGTYGDQQIAARLVNEIDALRGQGDDVALSALEAFKRRLDRSIKYNSAEMPAASEALLRMRTMLNEAIEGKADEVAGAAGVPEVAELFREAKAVWSSMRISQDVAKKQVSAQTSNRFIAPSDYGMGIGGAVISAATGGAALPAIAAGAGVAVAHNVVRKRGNQVAAAAFRGLSGNALLRKASELSPDMLGEFAGPISAAIARGADGDDAALSAVDYVLQQTNPEYRAMKEALAKEAQ